MRQIPTCLLAALLVAGPALAEEPIGHLKQADGVVTVARGENRLVLAAGQDLFAGDTVATSDPGAAGITLRDDTTLALGPDSRLLLDELVFEPGEGKLAMRMMLEKGTFAVTTGLIPKLAPENTMIATPTMTIGIRGTSFLVEVGQ